MSGITELIDRATNQQDGDFVTGSIIGTVVGRGGRILYQHVSGVGSAPDQPLTGDHLFWLASQSKLMCAVAAMQTVERGLIGLDDDIAPHVPELAALEVLDGGEDDKGVPTTKPRQNKITLRLLLSHQSGLGYDIMPFSLAKWAKATGLKYTTLDNTGIPMKTVPLAFEPGTSWTYGAGIDWAAEVVARLNKTTLEDYYRKNIWEPLGMTHTTFHPLKFPPNEIVQGFERQETGQAIAKDIPVPKGSPVEMGGHGVWGSANDYIKMLSALLDGGGPILSSKSVDEMFSPQMLHPQALDDMVKGPYKPVLGPSIPPDAKIDHGLSGLINLEAFPGRRAAGTLQWSGAPNLIWWIDRKTGIAATAFLQIMPPGDAIAGKFNVNFEEQVYKAFGKGG
ncbi:hypothetical protein Z517_01870 [Fonsecaea pedrosoi CBS 271.37]|uniref:Beta-lactamase-related domain-containing protein n=1 Tax=Fonsecaea pedrosoi CBS 271.37 TaxID=1442368 RepID=A0A0D2FIG7_9EURO|nr:uncharacterized protein Z517_01870 [Fonsecaea pedrosoi CBS 271.37]KIW86472.1 hypothetical protein Z517_01870 [Fonsecaea pedrosoi CBS 271.37]